MFYEFRDISSLQLSTVMGITTVEETLRWKKCNFGFGDFSCYLPKNQIYLGFIEFKS